MPNYHVVPRGKNFGVLKAWAKRVSTLEKTQSKAEAEAKKICHNAGGWEVRIHAVRWPGKWQIRDSDTVSPGHDPRPPIDKKH